MGTTGTKRNKKGERTLDGELGLIINELDRAMWAADKTHVGAYHCVTPNMLQAMHKFYFWCEENYGAK